MQKRFQNDDPAKPAVHEVECVKGDARQLEEWVVAPSQQEQRYHVHNRQHSCAFNQHSVDDASLLTPINVPDGQQDTGSHVQHQEQHLGSAWQCANIDSR